MLNVLRLEVGELQSADWTIGIPPSPIASLLSQQRQRE